MSFCKVSEIVPKNLLAVIPERYKGMKYKKLTVGDIVTITDITVVSYKARKDGDYIQRKDGSYILNQTCYFGLSDGYYTSIRNNTVLGQVASLTGWYENGEKDDYFALENPEKVKIIEVTESMGKGDKAKNVPVKAFESI